MKLRLGLAIATCLLAMPNVASAQLLYSEPFDSQGTSDVTINQQPDTFVNFVDYSNFTVGTTNFGIPEAPRPVAGGLATQGVLLQANVNPNDPADPTAGTPAAVNILAGAIPVNFSGDYILSYDVYLSISSPPFPTNGSTEQLLWGVGNDNSDPVEGRNTRNSGTVGTWGWLATENGYGTEDAAIFEDGTELADLGDTQLGEDVPFNLAFDSPVTPNAPNNAPANQWVEVDIKVIGGNVQVLYNGVEFFNEPSSATNGFAMLGYEDPFGSVALYDPTASNADPNFPDPFPAEDYQWGLFDNFTIQIPEPGSAILFLLGMGLAILGQRRR